MAGIEQGDLLKVEGFPHTVIVVSNNVFNRSGMAIVCPVLQTAVPGPLHIELKNSDAKGIVLCEQVKYLDLRARNYTRLGQTHYFDIMDFSDALMGIFEYQ